MKVTRLAFAGVRFGAIWTFITRRPRQVVAVAIAVEGGEVGVLLASDYQSDGELDAAAFKLLTSAGCAGIVRGPSSVVPDDTGDVASFIRAQLTDTSHALFVRLGAKVALVFALVDSTNKPVRVAAGVEGGPIAFYDTVAAATAALGNVTAITRAPSALAPDGLSGSGLDAYIIQQMAFAGLVA